jgi:hypothetical protein
VGPGRDGPVPRRPGGGGGAVRPRACRLGPGRRRRLPVPVPGHRGAGPAGRDRARVRGCRGGPGLAGGGRGRPGRPGDPRDPGRRRPWPGLVALAEGDLAAAGAALERAAAGWRARRRFWEGPGPCSTRPAPAPSSPRPTGCWRRPPATARPNRGRR